MAAVETEAKPRRGIESFNYKFKYHDDDGYWARQQQEPMTSRCVCGESFSGTVAEAIAWHAQHRKAKHPKANDRGQHARQKAIREAPKPWQS